MCPLKLKAKTEKFTEGDSRITKIYTMGDDKFKIYYENSNGSPMGFNYKKCCAIWDPTNKKWNNLHDIKDIPNIEHKSPNYYDVRATKLHADEFFIKMEQLIIEFYG